jgi:hypothetical protein
MKLSISLMESRTSLPARWDLKDELLASMLWVEC